MVRIMSDTPQPNGATPAEGPPSLNVLAQYLKDLSFESPNAPQSLLEPSAAQPAIDIDVNVNARGLGANRFEVELSASARARRDKEVVFVVEAAYAGAFEIRNVPADQMEMVLLVECPRILFPFLRQIIAEATRNGNFPPLLLEPIDFFTIYRQNAERARASGQQQPATA
jgi:preprotein translocase subunit SecB